MSEANVDKHSAELAAVRSSQHLSAWLLAILLLVLVVLGVYQIVQAHLQSTQMDGIHSRINTIENRLIQMKEKGPAAAPTETKKTGD